MKLSPTNLGIGVLTLASYTLVPDIDKAQTKTPVNLDKILYYVEDDALPMISQEVGEVCKIVNGNGSIKSVLPIASNDRNPAKTCKNWLEDYKNRLFYGAQDGTDFNSKAVLETLWTRPIPARPDQMLPPEYYPSPQETDLKNQKFLKKFLTSPNGENPLSFPPLNQENPSKPLTIPVI